MKADTATVSFDGFASQGSTLRVMVIIVALSKACFRTTEDNGLDLHIIQCVIGI
jgi:hypothetical protein